MDANKKATCGVGNTTGSIANQAVDSVSQPKGGVNPAGQYTAIRMAYHAAEKLAHEKNDPSILSKRVDTLVKQFAPYGFTREQVISIGSGSFGGDNDADFSKPVIMHKHPTVWTPEEETQLRVMKEKGVANSEICEQLHKTPQQVSSKWCFVRKENPQSGESAETLVPVPAVSPEPQAKAVPEFDLTALKKPIGEHLDIFDTLQNIMRQAGAGYVSVNVTREDGTKYRAEVRGGAQRCQF